MYLQNPWRTAWEAILLPCRQWRVRGLLLTAQQWYICHLGGIVIFAIFEHI
eukprot:NODE_22653_length_165_cov_0.879310_g22038_i0.p3 GENE.NODE_22653_length_165_cov_0.879310_g22038_i0~~NODE_22653_length_165_cov_0.879310_g22038_i0.p3  ORF type:complete len:51 (-),score=2.72 NODE_22653_length_165_cov_0.879310_g22038_i0:4-156(-)